MDVRKISSFILLGFVITACNSKKRADTTFKDQNESKTLSCSSETIKNQFIVQWEDGSFSVEKAADVETFKEDFIKPNLARIRMAEYDEVITVNDTTQQPDNPSSANSGSAYGSGEWGQAIIQADAAWKQGYFGQDILVGVVDTQIETSHPLIANQIMFNSKEIPNNNIDDDGNGIVDDYDGFHAVEPCTPTYDSKDRCQVHATHVSGIIAGGHIGGPMRGLAPRAKIIQGAFLDKSGEGTLSGAIAAMEYVTKYGAKIINASWGGKSCSQSLVAEFEKLDQLGVLMMVAAGNGDDYGRGQNIDSYPAFPARFQYGNQITVAASSELSDSLTSFSNFSATYVHLAAPGDNIYSSIPVIKGSYASSSGTSMATPFVTGAAAVLWSVRPNATPAQIKQALFSSVDQRPFLVIAKGRLNLAKAIETLKVLVP